jgi:uncharacterized protein
VARTPAEILADARTIALVGASPRPERPSNSVMRYLLDAGYRVIPVRPVGPPEIHGQHRVASLAEIEEPIDLVDVFRRPGFCPDVARQAVAAGSRSLWLQLGVVSSEARAIAEAAGLDYVEDECTAIVHRQIAYRSAGEQSGCPDLNRGPRRPERRALPGCATPRTRQ